MGYIVYAIRSLRNNHLYVGFTDRPAIERLAEHNAGKTSSIRFMRPFELVYQEGLPTRELAVKREKFLKSGKGRQILRVLLLQKV